MLITFERFQLGLTEILEPPVRKHLKNVYATTTLAVLMAIAGVCSYIFFGWDAEHYLVLVLGSIYLLIWLIFTQGDSENHPQRFWVYLLFAYTVGCGASPTVIAALKLDNPMIIVQAFFGMSVVFACFSLGALFAPRGIYLFLGGILSAALTNLLWLAMLNLFFFR